MRRIIKTVNVHKFYGLSFHAQNRKYLVFFIESCYTLDDLLCKSSDIFLCTLFKLFIMLIGGV